VSCSYCRPKPHLRTVELAQLSVMEEDPMHVFVHLFQSDLFIAQNFAHDHPAFVPTNIATVVHSPRLK